jgi:hypothetical protein
MKAAYLGTLMLVTAACGAYQFPGATPSPSQASARVSGTVLAVPCSPFEQDGTSCAGKPVADLEIDYGRGPAIVGRAMTNAKGAYVIDLPPGGYEVTLNTYMRVISGPIRLSLAAGTKTVADYLLDSGIRAPVPQQ